MKTCKTFQARNAIVFFFFALGVAYAQLTSRMPALKLNTGADDAFLGLAMLCIGIGSLGGFLFMSFANGLCTSRAILRHGSLVLFCALPVCALMPTPYYLCVACAISGLGFAICDVAMNIQAVIYESMVKKHCLAAIHACYSIGGLVGSLCGSAFAAMGFGPLINFSVVAVLLLIGSRLALGHLLDDKVQAGKAAARQGVPTAIYIFGMLAVCAFAVEGSCAEWSGLLLNEYKGASEAVAALGFGAFSVTISACRLVADRLRYRMGDFWLIVFSAITAICGLATVMLSTGPILCLLGYCLTGMGIAPVFPLIISRACSRDDIGPQKATSVVSLCGYGGLLVIPPGIGWLAKCHGLPTALLLPLGLGSLLLLFSGLFRQQSR